MADDETRDHKGRVICGAAPPERCYCNRPPHPVETPHLCKCGGAWMGNPNSSDFIKLPEDPT